MFWDVSIGVVFGETGKIDVRLTNVLVLVFIIIDAFKIWEIVIGEGLGDFDSAIGTEIVITKAVAVFY